MPTVLRAFRDLVSWHVRSQVHARRNALVACTLMAQRRGERDQAEEFLEAYLARRQAQPLTLTNDNPVSM